MLCAYLSIIHDFSFLQKKLKYSKLFFLLFFFLCLLFCLGVLPDLRQRLLPQPLTAASLESFAFGLGTNGLFLKKRKEFLLSGNLSNTSGALVSDHLLALSDPNRWFVYLILKKLTYLWSCFFYK